MDKRLIMYHIIKSLYPKIIFSLVIEPNFEVHGFYSDVEMDTLREYKISNHIRGAFNKFPDFFVRASKIVVDS